MKTKALFLDRDGVINVDTHYLHTKEECIFIEGIFDVCRKYISKGFTIFIVTNQSGIARGLFSESTFLDFMKWMKQRFLEEQIVIEHVYYCPHHPDITGDCLCRKPHPGMLLQAQKDYTIDMGQSVMIGDSQRDIQAAIDAKVGTQYLLCLDTVQTPANGGCIETLNELI